MRRALAAAAAVLLAIVMVVFAPSAVAQQPGCVFSGGGWICYGTQPPSEPGEFPIVEPSPVEVDVTGPEQPAEPDPASDPEPVPAPEVPAPVEPAPASPAPAEPPATPPSCG